MLILPSAVWSGSAGRDMEKAVLGRTRMSWDYHQNESHVFSVGEGPEKLWRDRVVRLFAYAGAHGLGHCVMSVMLFA